MLTAAEQADLQAIQGETLVETCVIRTMQLVSDGAGGHTETPVTVATVPCRVAPTELSRGEEKFAGQFISSVPYRITVPAGTALQLDYWIEVNGRVFNIMAIRGPRSFETALNALCREI